MVIGSDGVEGRQGGEGRLLSWEGWHLSRDLNERKDGRVQGTAGRRHTWIKVRGRKTGRRGWLVGGVGLLLPPWPELTTFCFPPSLNNLLWTILFSSPLLCFKSHSGQLWMHQSCMRLWPTGAKNLVFFSIMALVPSTEWLSRLWLAQIGRTRLKVMQVRRWVYVAVGHGTLWSNTPYLQGLNNLI